MKIHEVTAQYGITARTLRYYEDVGLITSLRSEDYAYRIYDEQAVRQIEQILILRKLDVSVKDIARVFSNRDAGQLLEVLGRKVQSIDKDLRLLSELKRLVLRFIHQLSAVDFKNSEDIRLLYESASVIEQQLTDTPNVPANIGRMMAVADQLERLPDVRVIEVNGDLYAAAISRGEDDVDRVTRGVRTWIDQTGYFSIDGRETLFCELGTDKACEAMGYSQIEVLVPITPRNYPNKLRGVSNMDIRRRINDGANLHFELCGDAPGREKRQYERYKMIRHGDGTGGMNAIYDVRLDGLSMPEIAALIEEIKAHGVHVWWDICFPQPVRELIFGKQLPSRPEPNDEEAYMAMFAREMPAYTHDPAIRVERVKDIDTFALWVSKVNEWFDEGELISEGSFHLIGKGAWSCYIGYLDGVPASVCVMMRDGDLGWLHQVVTNPELRRRGAARAVCSRAIEDAVNEGADLLTCDAWPGTKVLARELGFSFY